MTEIEELLNSDQRRVSVNQHAAFRERLAPPAPGDDLDDIAADPITERVNRQGHGKIKRVLEILDSIEGGAA